MATVNFNAIVLAGGRSSRLGGTPKALLSNGAQTLLDSTVNAVANARHTVVVGPADLPVPEHIILTREDPPFSGPAAALAAGAQRLAPLESVADWTVILSVDMPDIARALNTLLASAYRAQPEVKGLMGETDGIRQPLVGIYRTSLLIQALASDMTDCSVRYALRPLCPEIVQLPAGSTDDVDTWDSARAAGFDRQLPSSTR